MKKIFLNLTLAAAVLNSTIAVAANAYNYESSVIDYDNANSYYYQHSEKRVGAVSESDKFNGCDLYLSESTESYGDFPTLETSYEYIVAPDSVIGDWFVNEKKGNPYLSGDYEVKMPLKTSRYLDYITFELADSHIYDMYIECRKSAFVKIVTDDAESQPFDEEKVKESLPKYRKSFATKDDNGNYVWYITTDSGNITEEDAGTIAASKNEHLLALSYYEDYDVQHFTLGDSPSYDSDRIATVSEYLESCGVNFEIEEDYGRQKIVFADSMPALEYYELISKIQKNTDSLPSMAFYEDYMTETYFKNIFSSIKGDANMDGSFSIADMVTLQNFILGKGTAGANADINGDDSVDIFDMILMRKLFSENK